MQVHWQRVERAGPLVTWRGATACQAATRPRCPSGAAPRRAARRAPRAHTSAARPASAHLGVVHHQAAPAEVHRRGPRRQEGAQVVGRRVAGALRHVQEAEACSRRTHARHSTHRTAACSRGLPATRRQPSKLGPCRAGQAGARLACGGHACIAQAVRPSCRRCFLIFVLQCACCILLATACDRTLMHCGKEAPPGHVSTSAMLEVGGALLAWAPLATRDSLQRGGAPVISMVRPQSGGFGTRCLLKQYMYGICVARRHARCCSKRR